MPEALQKLISFYKKLPGIGEKSATRLALSTIEFSEEDIEDYSDALLQAKKSLCKCTVCGHLSDEKKCNICCNTTRNHNLICVIEDYKSVFAFESAGNYNGVYHVLSGLINPLNNISTEDINLSSLIKRVKELENPELILALKSNIEGETTSLYIKKLLENEDVKISRLSYGLPVGAEIDYLDVLTLDKALEDRKIISNKE